MRSILDILYRQPFFIFLDFSYTAKIGTSGHCNAAVYRSIIISLSWWLFLKLQMSKWWFYFTSDFLRLSRCCSVDVVHSHHSYLSFILSWFELHSLPCCFWRTILWERMVENDFIHARHLVICFKPKTTQQFLNPSAKNRMSLCICIRESSTLYR